MVKEDRGKLKEVLVIAYGFPPVGGSAAIRTLKFCKYLPQFFWKPVVLTVKKPRVFDRDPSLLEDLPKDIEVYRTATIELPYSLYKTDKDSGKGYNPRFSRLRRFLSSIFRKARYTLLIIDERIGWVPFVILSGLKIIRKKKDIKLIYISVKPFSSLLAAIFLRKLTRLPLVIDFRDAWTGFNRYFWEGKPAYFRRIEGFIERLAVQGADKIISVNENIIKDLRNKYISCPRDKFVYIPNGYDPQDFEGGVLGSPKDVFRISYAGSLYAKRSPENFLNALKVLLKKNPHLKDRLRFEYIGKVTAANGGFFEDEEIKQVIELCGVLPYKECLNRIRASNLLLFIEDQVEISDRLFPSKIFEYVASVKPILALAKNGPVSDFIQRTNSGVVLDYRDVIGIKEELFSFIKGEHRNSIPSDSKKEILSDYSREALTKSLALVFDGLAR